CARTPEYYYSGSYFIYFDYW
nr:immunoglobulin heavy chain junction region [Macaca mulatta]MPN69491.1 immunoglobulin heavy chain junction region [Macaca mulatta]MPN69600.1 immunoglobulin heavy chain junction region [Macaca mulatta]MPN69751.1 immunoglobulin heavy chain junction region [Macaca mulatta]MPN70097.1 immunoglobulin heavy chain junction region [Macaca mulatta]